MAIMTEKLPIAIQASATLLRQLNNISEVANKLEAQLNFHTMTANWYGDESNILFINFKLLSIDEFNEHDQKQQTGVKQEFLADDVFMLFSADHLRGVFLPSNKSGLWLLVA